MGLQTRLSRFDFLRVASLFLTATITGCAAERQDTPEDRDGFDAEAFDAMFGSFDHPRDEAEILSSGEIVFGVFSDGRPLAYIDGYGNYIGLLISFAETMGQRMGIRVSFVETDPENAAEYLLANKVDAVFGDVAFMDESFPHTAPFLETHQAIVCGDDYLLSEGNALTGLSTAVCSGTRAERCLSERGADMELHSYPTYTGTFGSLKGGTTSAVFADSLIATTWAKENPGFTVAEYSLEEPSQTAIFVAPENESLLARLALENYAIANDGTLEEQFKKHVGQPAEEDASLLPVPPIDAPE